MQHIHLDQTPSTQTLVKEHLAKGGSDILISTDRQTEGFGRQGSQWNHFDCALAFSFTLAANEVLTLTPLEIGSLLADFFGPRLLLKWPNDLLNNKKEKVGGILCQLVDKTVVIGVGLNLKNSHQKETFEYPVGAIFDEGTNLDQAFKKELPTQIVSFIKENRVAAKDLPQYFSQYCAHLNQDVRIINGKETSSGRFVGLGKNGEAMLEDKQGQLSKHLTGSLRFN